MKIAFLIPRLGGGGAEKIAAEISLNLSDEFEPIFILFENKIGYKYRGKVYSLDEPLTSNIFLDSIRFISRIIKFRKIVEKEKPDIIMSFDDYANFLNIFSNKKRIFNVHKSLSMADTQKNILKRMFVKLFRRLIYSYSDRIIVVSKGLKDEMISYVGIRPEKIVSIYNLYDISKIDFDKNKRPLILLPKPYILNIGRCELEKGQWYLIRAFSKVHSQIPDLRLVIIGKGSLVPYLKKLILDLQLSESIILVDSNFENVYPFMKDSEFFVLTSLFEGFPNVLIESMAVGTPIISTNCKSGPSEIMNKYGEKITEMTITDYGILIPPFDGKLKNATERLSKEEEILADAIIKLYRDRNLRARLSKNCKERAKNFDAKIIIKEYEKILKQV